MNTSKAKRVHYRHPWYASQAHCHTHHGHQITLTRDKTLVTCKRCLYQLGLHNPVGVIPFHMRSLSIHNSATLSQAEKGTQLSLAGI